MIFAIIFMKVCLLVDVTFHLKSHDFRVTESFIKELSIMFQLAVEVVVW